MKPRYVPYTERYPEARRAPVANLAGDATRHGGPASSPQSRPGRSPIIRVIRDYTAVFGATQTWEELVLGGLYLAGWGAVLLGLAVLL